MPKKEQAHGGRREGAGRKSDGRVRVTVLIKQDALKELDRRINTEHDSRGKVIEGLLTKRRAPRKPQK